MPAPASFSMARYYVITWQALILITTALAISAGAARPLLILPFALVAFLIMSIRDGLPEVQARRLTWGLGLILFVVIVQQSTQVRSLADAIEVMVGAISGALPLTLMTHRRSRSYWLSVLNVTVTAIGSISLGGDILTYLGFLLFVLILLFNLNAANLYLGERRPDHPEEALLPQGYFLQFMLALPAGLLATVVIFYAFPRAQSFSLSLGQLNSQPKTGYSGLVSLSGDGPIETSLTLAFLVEAPEKAWLQSQGPALLFRGAALETFDGQDWTSAVYSFQELTPPRNVLQTLAPGQDSQVLTVHREPTPSSAIFYPETLVELGAKSRHAGAFLLNANGNIIRDNLAAERFSYTLRITQRPPLAKAAPLTLAQVAAGASPTEAPYLQIPPQVKEQPWFQDWIREVGLSADTPLEQAVARILAHFGQGFEASMVNAFSKANALEAFLTTDRRGHCEYFATAAALLLRSHGIPSRVVVGYRGGTYNHLIDILEVREENAHAWVEALLPGLGWLALDPTPSVPSTVGALTAQARLYLNAVSYWIRRYVVDYDQRTQRELLHSLRNLATRDQRNQIDWKSTLQGNASPALITLLALLLLWLSTRLARRRATAAETYPAYYTLFVERLGRLGLARRPGETLAGFHARLIAAGIDADLVREVDTRIEQDLYARAGIHLPPPTDWPRRLAKALTKPRRHHGQ